MRYHKPILPARSIVAGLLVAVMLAGEMPGHAEIPVQRDQAEEDTQTPLNDDECAVWAALGRKVFGWGEKPADSRQFVIFYKPAGTSYVEQCPWSRLKVTPPPKTAPDLNNIEFFGTPVFDKARQKAEVTKTTRIGGAGPGPRAPFMQMDRCTLHKSRGVWTVDSCKMAAIT